MTRYLPDPVLPGPKPDLSPEDVVKLQLDALQNNDLVADNAGIRAAYRFASPANRRATGPVERFIAMVKNPLYETMIGFREAHLLPAQYVGTQARLQVHLIAQDNQPSIYIFTLSKQINPPYRGCWMVDSVLRIG